MTRRANDQYFTPEFATRELLTRIKPTGLILECCAGTNAIAHVLAEQPACGLFTNDLDPAMKADYHQDVSRADGWDFCDAFESGINWIITNPPFSVAPYIVPLAFDHAQIGIAMLLRKSFTESCFDRQEWLHAHRRNLTNQIHLPRISFTSDGETDLISCDWYVWRKTPAIAFAGCEMDWVLKPGTPRSRREVIYV